MTEETTPPDIEDTSGSEPVKRLKETDWIVITALWERGEVTLSDLSDKFGISKAALSQGLKRRSAVRGSKAHIATKRVQDKIEAEKEKLLEDIYQFKKRFIKNGDYLVDLAINTLKKHDAAGTIANCRGELASIFEATKTFKTIRSDLYHLYDLNDKEKKEGENYDFNIGVYSEQDIEALREAQNFVEAEERKMAEGRDEDEDGDDDRIYETGDD